MTDATQQAIEAARRREHRHSTREVMDALGAATLDVTIIDCPADLLAYEVRAAENRRDDGFDAAERRFTADVVRAVERYNLTNMRATR